VSTPYRPGLQNSDATFEQAVEEFREATAATTRSIAEDGEIEVQFGPTNPSLVGNTLHLPTPSRALIKEDIARLRGEADAVALRRRYHDPKLHRTRTPHDENASAVFDAFEQVRCESLGVRYMAGASANLEAALEEHCRAHGYAEVEQGEHAPLPDVLRMLAREAITGKAPPPSATKMVDLWRPILEPKIAPALTDLADLIDDQRAFADQSRELLKLLGMVEEEEAGSETQDDDSQENDGENEEGDGQSENETMASDGEASEDPEGQETSAESGEETADGDQSDLSMTSMGEDEAAPEEQPPSPYDGRNEPIEGLYRAFTDEFDEIVEATELCDADELTRLRQQLDQHLAHLQSVIGKLANRLQRRLMARQSRAWDFDLEEGILDAARLARIVANPLHALSFKREKDTDFRDTVVTLLIDNSGSMRGRPITLAAISADILARTLERCGVKVEILGFTTRAWKGGQSREKWLSAGKPANAGRLNDLRHIVYKSAKRCCGPMSGCLHVRSSVAF
jgi:cobaltochelatase CobT